MKIQITTKKPDEVQRFFSAPLSFSQKVTMKKLLIVEQILERMKALGLNRSKLAAQMEISPARVTTTSIQYEACREMIANFTARSLHGILSLPSISFRNPKEPQQ